MAKSYDVTLEGHDPVVAINGLNTNLPAYFDSTVEVNGALTLDSTVAIAGAVDITGALTVNGAVTATGAISSVSTVTAKNATAFPASGVAGALAFGFSSVSAQGIYFGTGYPGGATGQAAATGSLYFNAAGSATGDRAYICKGGTAWTAIITSA